MRPYRKACALDARALGKRWSYVEKQFKVSVVFGSIAY
jgi:hypothetical protein